MARHHHVGAQAPDAAECRPAAPLGAHAGAPAGLSRPPNDEAPGWQAEGFNRGQDRTDSGDCADLPNPDQPADGERFDTLRAALAQKGFALHLVDAGGQPAYLVVRWNLSRTLPDMAAVDGFACQVGAQP